MEHVGLIAASVSLLFWVGILVLRGGFWRTGQRLADPAPELSQWPGVVCVIPARNEASTIGGTVKSLLEQDYPAPVSVIVVDDNSDDGTANMAKAAAAEGLTVVTGKPLADGWSGKLWAVKQGLDAAEEIDAGAAYILLTDADITHDSESLRRLVAKAEGEGLHLVSLMVRLRCESRWEKLLIPAFIFFFQKLYPFQWVNDPARPLAAAAGGCMLIRRDALRHIGGVDAIRGRLIDDCALAAQIKKHGPIWLGLSTKVRSERAYGALSEIWDMVARTAFEQLGNSVLALIGTVLAMTIAYLVPPVAAAGVFGGGAPALTIAALGMVTWWGLMGIAYQPTLSLYGMSRGWSLLLPVAALLFTLMTVSSAIRYWRGRGAAWKGRHYKVPAPSGG
jgi:hopene-associated glycosyltransferase HpnB